MHPAYRAALRACGLDSVEQALSRTEGRVVAWSRTTETLYVPCPHNSVGFYVKRHYFTRWSNRWRGMFRGTFFGPHRGQAEYRALEALRGEGVPAVRPVACGSRRVAHFVAACFLITEEVPGAVNLTSFAQQVADGTRALNTEQRTLLADTLAKQVAAMHAGGVVHGNLYWRNILIRQGLSDAPEFFLLDPRPRRPWQRWPAGRDAWLTELAQLAVSAKPFTTRSERLRFIKRYGRAVRLSPRDRQEIRQVERQAEQGSAHELRRIHMNGLFEQWNAQLARENGAAAGAP